MGKVGIVVGRFQTPYLHEGHKYLINKVSEENDKVIIVIGVSPTRVTTKNPLPLNAVKNMMIMEYRRRVAFNKLEFKFLEDKKSDKVWSQNLDALLPEGSTLYGSRDSFIKYYCGKFPTKEIETSYKASATQIREDIINSPIFFDRSAREALIWSTGYRFPTTYSCVDIFVTSGDNMLLGRKKDSDKWCFPGGFVDPSDKSLELAAKRELSEEVPNLAVSIRDFQYLGSSKIDDWRYRGTQDGIMTTLFHVEIYPLLPKLDAGDDLEEVRWFDINEFDITEMVEEHRDLYKKFKDA